MSNVYTQRTNVRLDKPSIDEVKKYTFFEQDKLNEHWVHDYAEVFSTEILCSQRMNITQLRAFFNEFLKIQDGMREDGMWQIQLKMLEAKAVYRSNSSQAKIPQDFTVFITKLVYDIEGNARKFNYACLIMEAIVAYFRKPENSRRN